MSSESAGSLINALITVFFLAFGMSDSLLITILHIFPSEEFYKPMNEALQK